MQKGPLLKLLGSSGFRKVVAFFLLLIGHKPFIKYLHVNTYFLCPLFLFTTYFSSSLSFSPQLTAFSPAQLC